MDVSEPDVSEPDVSEPAIDVAELARTLHGSERNLLGRYLNNALVSADRRNIRASNAKFSGLLAVPAVLPLLTTAGFTPAMRDEERYYTCRLPIPVRYSGLSTLSNKRHFTGTCGGRFGDH